MMIQSQESECISSDSLAITSAWKLYENPCYLSIKKVREDCRIRKRSRYHLHQPVSARKIAASFWDLAFIRPIMESMLEKARSQIIELKAELEKEHNRRKKVEYVNKKLVKQVSEERKGREAMERLCDQLAKQVSSHKGQINGLRKEIKEERKMLQIAEVLREERVQMKLAEAKSLLEEKILELNTTKKLHIQSPIPISESKVQESLSNTQIIAADYSSSSSPSSNSNVGSSSQHSTLAVERKASPKPENPHIKRGEKGFIEFPMVVKAIGCKSRHLGTKLKCQKAQLRFS
ncbi:PREDICTED: protein BRANCHLESS TRICHOME-like [Ipomoea nil]|uniref:protein BRANCHLESS TRICHOME-like n=1 Tax=Ipomoea nil TaxID=35883 RepID=UPI0009018704|nr:PREDICTED: protein BRANCHLESS TRICHOME-like [Ipomoea nil]